MQQEQSHGGSWHCKAMGISFVLFIVFLVMFILKYRKKEQKNDEPENSVDWNLLWSFVIALNMNGTYFILRQLHHRILQFGENEFSYDPFLFPGRNRNGNLSLLAMVKWEIKCGHGFLPLP